MGINQVQKAEIQHQALKQMHSHSLLRPVASLPH